MRAAREKSGRRAEQLAALYLRAKGYRLLAKRYRSPVGEIDLVMQRRQTLVFVEVKKRQVLDAALWSIRPQQIKRMRRAAEHYIAQHPKFNGLDMRFDAMFVAPWRWPRHHQHISDGL